MVEHKASCERMATALLQDQLDHREDIQRWRREGISRLITERASHDDEAARQLNRLIIRGDIVHAYCAYQESFRDQLRAGLSHGSP